MNMHHTHHGRPQGELIRQETRPLRTLAIIATLVALAGLVGCGKQPKRLEVYPVQGKISYAGKAPAGANVYLHPLADDPNLPRPQGVVAPDGTFTVKTYGDDNGAPVGKYKVVVQWYKPVIKGDEVDPGKNLLPAKYADAKKSDLEVEIIASNNQLPPLTLKR